MRLSRRELLAGTAALAAGLGARVTTMPELRVQGAGRLPAPAPHVANLPIRDYLVREAQRITDGALGDLKTVADVQRLLPERRRRFMDMMGLADLPAADARPPVPTDVTGVIDRDRYRIEKLHYQSLPNLHVTANLYVPDGIATGERRPGVLYVCGHVEQQKVQYQAHARRFAELGFPTLIVETVQLGEAPGYHHGCYREGWFHWYSRGYSPAAVELLNGIRGLDLLAARPDVDSARLGVTGISGGGATTWWIAAADERVKACAPVCGTATLASHIYDRVIDGHCDCMWWMNTALWDLADVGALIAPRALMIASANQDGIFPIHAIRAVHTQLAALYHTLDHDDRVRLVETPGGHSYHEQSRTAIFSWFLEHLMDKRVAPSEVGDIELDPAKLESADALKVYTAGMPPGNRAVTIQDDFITLAPLPAATSAGDVEATRRRVVAQLKADTFHHFPSSPPPLALDEEYALDGGIGTRFAFTSEDGWRLHGTRRNPREGRGARPALVLLKSPGEERAASDTYLNAVRAPWVKVVIETRGTGDTSWGDDLNWHVRRAAAWTGRTIASLRVWDTLRAIEAVRALPGVDRERIALAARGEMAAVASYAALLDGGITSVILDSPPPTQNAPGQRDGKGPALEMLNCLRYTDLPHIAGLLHPARIVIVGDMPEPYRWAAALFTRLGAADRFRRVTTIADWAPLS